MELWGWKDQEFLFLLLLEPSAPVEILNVPNIN